MTFQTQPQRAKSSVTGLGGGFFSGLLGVGGGIVMVPLLTNVLKLTQRIAHGTSLAIIIFTAAVALIPYALAGNVDWRLVATLGAGTGVGAYVGSRALHHIPDDVLRRLFGLLLIAVAIRMLVG